jgi:hypothetical protein
MQFALMRQLDSPAPFEARVIAKEFARWLDATGGSRLVLQLLKLERQIRRLDAECSDYYRSLPEDGPDSDDVSEEMEARLKKMILRFNLLISRCQIYPSPREVSLLTTNLRFRWELVRAPRRPLNPGPNWRSNARMDDLDALLCIVYLAQTGYLSRVEKCHCGRWYFQRVDSQQFCSAKCRQWQFSKSERFRAHRRAYMRRYYKLKASGKVK